MRGDTYSPNPRTVYQAGSEDFVRKRPPLPSLILLGVTQAHRTCLS